MRLAALRDPHQSRNDSMHHDHSLPPDSGPPDTAPKSFWRSRYAIGFIVFSAVAAYFLLSEHRAHFLGALPWLLILACPLMHIFMHHGHGGHGGSEGHNHDSRQNPDTSAPPPPPPPKTGQQHEPRHPRLRSVDGRSRQLGHLPPDTEGKP